MIVFNKTQPTKAFHSLGQSPQAHKRCFAVEAVQALVPLGVC